MDREHSLYPYLPGMQVNSVKYKVTSGNQIRGKINAAFHNIPS